MRLPSFTRQDAWVYGPLLLTVLCGAAFVALPFVRRHWLAEGIRSRVHQGQSMPEVLAAAEEALAAAEGALAAQGVLAPGSSFMYYLVTVRCEERRWSLWRDSGRDGAEFRIHVSGSDTAQPSFPVPPTRDEVFRFAEANAHGCTVHVSPGEVGFTTGDDGRVAEVRPPRR